MLYVKVKELQEQVNFREKRDNNNNGFSFTITALYSTWSSHLVSVTAMFIIIITFILFLLTGSLTISLTKRKINLKIRESKIAYLEHHLLISLL